jgi:hypothetical protein
MKFLARFVFLLALGASALCAQTPAPPKKNWTPPSYKMYVQTLSEQIMAAHPELISVTFHGVPPGLTDVYTMFGGSYLDRIGNPDDPDDILISKDGVTIIDPRWHRPKDPIKKFVMMVPLRDASGENCGLLVLAYHHEANDPTTEMDFYKSSYAIRDALQKQIPTYAALYAPAK